MIAAAEKQMPLRAFLTKAKRAGRSQNNWGRAVLTAVVLCWAVGLFISFSLGVTLITVIGFVAAIAGARQRFVGLLGIGILCTADTVTRGYVAYSSTILRWNSLNYFLLAVIILNVPLLLKLKGGSIRLLQYLVVLLTVEISTSIDPSSGALTVLNVVTCFGLVVYYVRALDLRQRWYWFSLVCGVTAALGGFVFFLQREHLPDVNLNAVAQFPLTGILAICVGLSLARLEKDKISKKKQLILGFIAAANFCWVFLSTSRGALLTASLCILYLLGVIQGVTTRLSLAIAGAGLAALILMNYSDLQSVTLERLDKTFDTSRSAVSRTTGRSDLALGGWYLFLDHPLGVGTGAFSERWSQLGPRSGLSGFAEGKKKESHSGWIKTLAENGAPGILLLVALVASFGVAGYRSRNRLMLLFGTFVSLCLSVALVSTEFQSKGLWMMVAALLAGFYQVARERGRQRVRSRVTLRRRRELGTLANA